MKIRTTVRQRPAPKTNRTQAPRSQTAAAQSPDSVSLISRSKKALKKNFKLGTLFWGALGATVSAIPVVGTWAITKGSAALPWAMDTEYNDSRHSSLKSAVAGVGGLLGGAALNLGGAAACMATGSVLPMIPAAIAGGYLFGKMAHIDSTLGKWDLFG